MNPPNEASDGVCVSGIWTVRPADGNTHESVSPAAGPGPAPAPGKGGGRGPVSVGRTSLTSMREGLTSRCTETTVKVDDKA